MRDEGGVKVGGKVEKGGINRGRAGRQLQGREGTWGSWVGGWVGWVD